MDYRILGPLEVRHEREPILGGGPRQRALLTLLLLHPNQPLPANRLIEDLWHDQPPSAPMRNLQMQIARLRRALPNGHEDLTTVPGGYRLRVAADALDVLRFERGAERGRRLVAEGRFEEASAEFAAALGEWRGGALDDVAYEPFAQAQIGRLQELRIATYEEYFEAELALGHHNKWIATLQTLEIEHPYRERITAQLVLALYRAGRQADALDAFQRARRRLADELALEPGRELQEL